MTCIARIPVSRIRFEGPVCLPAPLLGWATICDIGDLFVVLLDYRRPNPELYAKVTCAACLVKFDELVALADRPGRISGRKHNSTETNPRKPAPMPPLDIVSIDAESLRYAQANWRWDRSARTARALRDEYPEFSLAWRGDFD